MMSNKFTFKCHFYLWYLLRNPAHPGETIDMAVPRTVVTSLPVEMHDDDDVDGVFVFLIVY